MAIYPGTLRSSQIDAADLDEEFAKILNEQIVDLGFLGMNFSQFKPEVDLVLDFVLNYSILASGQSYGLSLENLVYKASNHEPLSKLQKKLYILSRIITVWGWQRFQLLMNGNGWSESSENSWKFKIWNLLQRFEIILKGLNFLNFLLFLRSGRFRSLTDRFLRMTLVYDQPKVHRVINYEFMNQQLVWQAFTEFFVNLLPVINVNAWTRKLKSKFGQKKILNNQLEGQCMVCIIEERSSAIPQIPYITNCNHVYCYYCIKSEMMSSSSYRCPRCNSQVQSIMPLAR